MPLHKQHRELVDHILSRRKKGQTMTFIHNALVRSGYNNDVVATALHDYSVGLSIKNPYIKKIQNALASKHHLYHVLDKHLDKDFLKIQDAIYALSTTRRSSLYDYLVHMRVHFYFQIACVVILLFMTLLFSMWFLLPLLVIALEYFVLNTHFRHHHFHKLDWYPFKSFKILFGSMFYEHLGAAAKRRGYFIGPQGLLFLLLCSMGVYFGVYGSGLLAVLSIFTGFLCFVSFNDHIF